MARTILIVDDHASFRECARSLLEAEGFEVVGEAENGVAALHLASDFDGFEVADRLRKLDSPPDVVLTSSRDDYAALVEDSAARAFVRKDQLSGATLASALG